MVHVEKYYAYHLFYSINDSDDPFQRMLAVLRFTFSKELKFIVSSLRLGRITLRLNCSTAR